MLNYFKKVEDIKEITTAPTYLESTSLVFAHGLDVFFTQTAPSNTFDVLNSDFNYQALLLTTVSLLVFTIVADRVAKKRDIAWLWR